MTAHTLTPRDFILNRLERKAPLPTTGDLDAYRYLDKGHVDSLGLIKFIFEIEDAFDITLTPEDTQSDAFRTVGGLAALIEAKRTA